MEKGIIKGIVIGVALSAIIGGTFVYMPTNAGSEESSSQIKAKAALSAIKWQDDITFMKNADPDYIDTIYPIAYDLSKCNNYEQCAPIYKTLRDLFESKSGYSSFLAKAYACLNGNNDACNFALADTQSVRLNIPEKEKFAVAYHWCHFTNNESGHGSGNGCVAELSYYNPSNNAFPELHNKDLYIQGITKFCAQGEVEACAMLGDEYVYGVNVKYDLNKAKELYSSACSMVGGVKTATVCKTSAALEVK